MADGTWAWGAVRAAATGPGRPVVVLTDSAHGLMWDRFYAEFRFRPGMDSVPAIDEPECSVTWRLGTIDEEALQRIVQRGLRAVVRPGEDLCWLDWQHSSGRFDPHRVGGLDQPLWPGMAYPDDEYHLYLTPDLRLGTFGHPWEKSLCVFGSALLAEVEAELTALLGEVLRRGGRSA